jgi:hypothetical protein
MFKRINQITCALMLGWLIFIPWQVRSQGAPKLNSLGVDLWPEYDAPKVLVIYRIVVSPDTSLPVDLTFRIPAAAGEPNAVANLESNGTLTNINYNRQVDGDWASISFTATMPELQMEYYDPGLVKQGNQRQFEYRWLGDYAVDDMTVQVQQPVGASNMGLAPAADSSAVTDGLTYYTKQVGALPAGQSFSLNVSYQKDTDTLSAESLQVKPSAPLTETSSTERALITALPWALGVLGVALLVGGAVWYWQSGKKRVSAQTRRRRSSTGQEPREPAVSEGYVYCHQCGKRAGPGDRFCRTCGTKLRLE